MLVFTGRGKPEGREDQTEGERNQGFSFGHTSLEKVVGSVGGDEVELRLGCKCEPSLF